MSLQAAPARMTMVQQLARALADVPGTDERSDVRRRAFMYAEAVDESDEADALFRFGPRLRACVEPLGLTLSSRAGVMTLRAMPPSVAA
ncbi:MAG: hypothetical protein ACRYG2_06455 [Janthinobacterium lividum]